MDCHGIPSATIMNKFLLEMLRGDSQARIAAVIAMVLCCCALACRHREAADAEPIPELSQARWIEPRLTGASHWTPCRRTLAPGRMIESADCSDPHTSPPPLSIHRDDCMAAIE